MRFFQKHWVKRFAAFTLAGACFGAFAPETADAQIFGGRIRNWIRGNRVERLPPDEGVIIERRNVGPQIVLPGDPEAAYNSAPWTEDGTDYGAGVSDRVRRERGFSIRRRASQTYDDIDADVRSEGRTVRSLESRRLQDRWQREDEIAVDRRRQDTELDARSEDLDVDPRLSEEVEPRRGERTVRVDRFERSSRVRPAEDPYEPVDRERSVVTSRGRTRILDDRSLSRSETEERSSEVRDPRRLADDELLEEPPAGDLPAPRSDERVRPAAAEEKLEEMPEAVDRDQAAAIDDFDLPRSARDGEEAEAVEEPLRRPTTRPASARDKTEGSAAERERPRAAGEDSDLLPPPPDDE